MVKYNYLFYGYKGSCVIIGHLFSNHLFVKSLDNKSNFTFQCLKMQQLLNVRTTKIRSIPGMCRGHERQYLLQQAHQLDHPETSQTGPP